MKSLLLSHGGLRVLYIGCGFGDFCHYAREQDARIIVFLNIALEFAHLRIDFTNKHRCPPIPFVSVNKS